MDLVEDENIEWLMESAKTVENMVDDIRISFDSTPPPPQDDFTSVLNSVFEKPACISDNTAYGIVQNEENLKQLLTKLKALGYFFVKRSSSSKKPNQNCRILLNSSIIPFAEAPFQVTQVDTYYCTSGMSVRQKVNNIKRKRIHSCEDGTDKYTGCLASMIIREIKIFPELNVPTAKIPKLKTLKKARHILKCKPDLLLSKKKYCVRISLPEVHNHNPRLSQQYICEEVKAAMYNIVRSGVTRIPEIQNSVKELIESNFKDETFKPESNNSAFYPSHKVIYNHLRHEGLNIKRRKSVVEKEKLDKIKNKLESNLKFMISLVSGSDDEQFLLDISKLLKRTQQLTDNV